jgi:uncharacterized protein (DUF3084 family)
MPTELLQLVQVIGAPSVMALIIVLVFMRRESTNSKQDSTITDFSVSFNAERKQLQESNNHLQAEVFNIKLEQAKEAGRREELKEAMQRERDEWKTERLANDEKFRLMAIDISELKKHREQSTLRISELEHQIAELEKKLATANVEIDLLTAQKVELEKQLERERNRADTLNGLVTQLQKVDPVTLLSDNTQAIPELWNEDSEQTLIVPPNPHEDPKPLPRAVDDTPDSLDKSA